MGGHTDEGRVNHFVGELAHIGRRHNWDRTRIKVNASGEPLLDESGKPIEEEYDDLTGDKPSCYSGVKRGLFQFSDMLKKFSGTQEKSRRGAQPGAGGIFKPVSPAAPTDKSEQGTPTTPTPSPNPDSKFNK